MILVIFPVSLLKISNTWKITSCTAIAIAGVFGFFYFLPESQLFLVHKEDLQQYFWLVKRDMLSLIVLGVLTSVLAILPYRAK